MTGSELRYIRRTERLRSFCSAARRAGTSPAIAALMQMQYSRAYRSPAEAGVRYHESRSAAFNADAASCGLLPRTSILRRYMSLSDCHCPGTSPLSSSVAAPLKSPDISFSLARKKRRLKPNESNMLDQVLPIQKGLPRSLQRHSPLRSFCLSNCHTCLAATHTNSEYLAPFYQRCGQWEWEVVLVASAV
jgi:hypothetical protein